MLKLLLIFSILYFIGLYSFCIKSGYLLSMLLSLEFMNLLIFFCIYMYIWMNLEKYILMFYLVFCVCEGAFGVSLLVMMVRFEGNDFFKGLNFLKC